MKTIQERNKFTQKLTSLKEKLERLESNFESGKNSIYDSKAWRLMLIYGIFLMIIYLIIQLYTPWGFEGFPTIGDLKESERVSKVIKINVLMIPSLMALMWGGPILYLTSKIFTNSMWVLKIFFPKFHARIIRIEANDYSQEKYLTELYEDIENTKNQISECERILEEYRKISGKVYQFTQNLFNSRGVVSLSDIKDDELKSYFFSMVEAQIIKPK